MYPDLKMQESIKKVEAARAENVKLDPRRMTAEEKEEQEFKERLTSEFKIPDFLKGAGSFKF